MSANRIESKELSADGHKLNGDQRSGPGGVAARGCLLVVLLTSLIPSARSQTSTGVDADTWVCEWDVRTQTSVRLFSVSSLNGVGSVCYCAEDSRITFGGLVPGRHSTSSPHVFVSQRDGSERQDLGPGQNPSWSPRGRRLCFSRNSPEYGVWLMSSDGSEAELLDNRGWGGCWSNGGQRIAYSRPINQRPNIVVWDLVEDELSSILDASTFPDGSRIAAQPRWSPDDRSLAFRVSTEGSQQLHIMSFVRPHSQSVAYRGEHLQPDLCWLDESHVVVSIGATAPNRNQLFLIDASNANVSPVKVRGQFEGRSNTRPFVSRDGGRLLYVSRPQS